MKFHGIYFYAHLVQGRKDKFFALGGAGKPGSIFHGGGGDIIWKRLHEEEEIRCMSTLVILHVSLESYIFVVARIRRKQNLEDVAVKKRVLKEGCQFSNSSTPRGSNACATDNERFEGAYHNNHNCELFMGIKKFSEHQNMMHPLQFLSNPT